MAALLTMRVQDLILRSALLGARLEDARPIL